MDEQENSGLIEYGTVLEGRSYLPTLGAKEALEFRDGLSYLFRREIRARRMEGNDSVPYDVLMGAHQNLFTGHVVVWKHDMWTAAINGHEVFKGEVVQAHMLNPDNQVWIPDIDLLVKDREHLFEITQDDKYDILAMAALSVKYHKDVNLLGIVAYYVYPTDTPERMERVGKDPDFKRVWVGFGKVELNKPAETENETSTLALLNFMNLEVVCNDPYVPLRAERRRAQKAGETLPTASVIKLRRSMQGQIIKEDRTTEEKTVEWSCQWLVEGHWRKQWYPSTKENKIKYIAPYFKGPADKPFRSKNRVFAVVR